MDATQVSIAESNRVERAGKLFDTVKRAGLDINAEKAECTMVRRGEVTDLVRLDRFGRTRV